jgi:exosome complex component RRP42
MFDDDWEASVHIYPRQVEYTSSRPPITLLVIVIGQNILFDPSKEELAVAETALAISVSEVRRKGSSSTTKAKSGRELRLLAIRTIDPPSRLTPPGVPLSTNTTGLQGSPAKQVTPTTANSQHTEGVWRAPLGGTKFSVLERMIRKVLDKGGVADEVIDGLEGVELS